MSIDPVLLTMYRAGALPLDQLLYRFTSNVESLHDSMQMLLSNKDINVRGDREAVDKILEKLQSIASQPKDLEQKQDEIIKHLRSHDDSLREVEISLSSAGYRKALREYAA